MDLPVNGNREFIRKHTDIILENLEDENFGARELFLKTGLGF